MRNPAEAGRARPERDREGLERIVAWAGQVVGTPNGYICLIEPGSSEMVLRLGTGAYTDLVGLRMLKGEGLSGRVWETGAPLAIPDYSRWEGRVPQIAADALDVDIESIDLRIGDTNLPPASVAGGSSGITVWGSTIFEAARVFRERHGQSPSEGDTVEAGTDGGGVFGFAVC